MPAPDLEASPPQAVGTGWAHWHGVATSFVHVCSGSSGNSMGGAATRMWLLPGVSPQTLGSAWPVTQKPVLCVGSL